MAAQITLPKTEFRVEDAPTYNQANPIRWVLSHLSRYKLLLAAFLWA